MSQEPEKWPRMVMICRGLIQLFLGCLIVELLLPMSPTAIEAVLKWVFPTIGPITLLQKPLVVSSMMLPLVMFVRTTGKISRAFVALMVLGVVLYSVCVIVESPLCTAPSKSANLVTLYALAGSGVALTASLRLCSQFLKYVIRPLRSNR